MRGQESDFSSKSFWLSRAAYEPDEPLRTRIRADVAVIGGGFTGLSTAFELKEREPGLEVVLLEREVIGFGASGRTGAFVGTLLGWNINYLIVRYGDGIARLCYQAMVDAVNYVSEMINKHQLDCDYERTGILTMARGASQDQCLRRDEENFHRLGFKEVRYLDASELKAELNISGYRSALYEPDCTLVDPAKLCWEWKRLLLERGVKIYERTPALRIEQGEKLRLPTPEGEVEAEKVMVATNAYVDQVSCFKGWVLPLFTYIVLTEPLARNQMEALGWKKRQALENQRNNIHYLRLTRDNRILIGGEIFRYGYNNRLQGMDRSEFVFSRLRTSLQKTFPDLGGINFSHMWGGPLAISLDFMPTFNVAGEKRNIFYAGAYCGHGASLGNFTGKILVDIILGREGPYSDLPFVRNHLIYIPGEPWRYIGYQVIDKSLRLLDWWQDRF